MARSAMAQERLCALRHEIARIEGTLPGRLEAPANGAREAANAVLTRRRGRGAFEVAADLEHLSTGADRLDAALDGGIPRAALTEVTSTETRDAGAAAGFAMALAARAVQAAMPPGSAGASNPNAGPVLWIGQGDIFLEAGSPYAPGVCHAFGLRSEKLLLSRVARLPDALWIAEEAAGLGRCAAVLVELRGNPARLDLTATRRLHRRAGRAGRPVFLVREAAFAEPTAAPLRLAVAPAPSALRHTLAGALPHSIGPPAFAVTIDKSRAGPAGSFILEWNADEHAFRERPSEDPGALVSASFERPADAAPARQLLAFALRTRRAG